MEKLEDGFYQARDGNLQKLVFEDDGMKKIRVNQETFQVVQEIQKRMRKLLGGHKPDISLVVEAMLKEAAQAEGIEETVRLHALRVFSSGSNSQNRQ